jgi:hypothetical protein
MQTPNKSLLYALYKHSPVVFPRRKSLVINAKNTDLTQILREIEGEPDSPFAYANLSSFVVENHKGIISFIV